MAEEVKEERTTESADPVKTAKSLIFSVGLQGRLVYACLLFLFFTELVLSYFLYEYISSVEKRCVEVDLGVVPTRSTRRKRSPVLEDNAVTTADDANVEFFNPKLRHELDEKELSKHGGSKFKHNGVNSGGGGGGGGGGGVNSGNTGNPGGTNDGDNPWVWLTAYSRIPVSCNSCSKRAFGKFIYFYLKNPRGSGFFKYKDWL